MAAAPGAISRSVFSGGGGVSPGTPGAQSAINVYNALTYGAKGDGATDDQPILTSLANVTIPASGGTLYLPPGNYVIGSNLTIPKHVTLWMAPGAQLITSLGNVVTVTINGPFRAERTPVFERLLLGADPVTVVFGSSIPEVFAEWWGANPNGVASCVPAVTAAIASVAAKAATVVTVAGQTGATVRLGAGEFLFDGTVAVPSYIRIKGAGDSTYLVAKPMAAGYSIFRVSANGANSVHFEDFQIDGRGNDPAWGAVQAVGIEFANAAANEAIYCKLVGLRIKNMSGYGVKINYVSVFSIINCTIRDSYNGNIYVTNANDMVFSAVISRSAKNGTDGLYLGAGVANVIMGDCNFSDCGRNGVRFDGATRCTLADSLIRGSTSDGVDILNSCIDISVVDCLIEANGRDGVFGDLGVNAGISVNGCRVRNNARSGILLYNVDDSEVKGNQVHGNNTSVAAGHSGIFIGTGNRNHIALNTVRQRGGSQAYGINIAGGSGALVSNNDLLGSGSTAALNDAGAATVSQGNRVA